MVSQVPAAEQALGVLRHLAAHPGPVPAATIARDLGLPRSTTYHLLAVLVREGFAVHLPEERRYGLGVSAFELGSAYARQAPLQRLARPLLARLVDATGHSAHLAVLHGRDVLYVLEERAPGRPPLVTDVGVRLPAHLTASGRALLAGLPASQVRALFPDRTAFVHRHQVGPASLPVLRRVLTDVRSRGYADRGRRGDAGFRLGRRRRLRPHRPSGGGRRGHLPVAGRPATGRRAARWPDEVRRTADQLTRRVGGRP